MPDITMCKDIECPYNKSCYRFTAKPNKYRQSYFKESPRQQENGRKDWCDKYWLNKNSELKD